MLLTFRPILFPSCLQIPKHAHSARADCDILRRLHFLRQLTAKISVIKNGFEQFLRCIFIGRISPCNGIGQSEPLLAHTRHRHSKRFKPCSPRELCKAGFPCFIVQIRVDEHHPVDDLTDTETAL